MKYINPNSKSGLVNKFADYILKHVDDNYISCFEVIFFGGFFVIKGLTESDKILNLQEIRNSFVEKYEYLLSAHGLQTINFIDVVKYNYSFSKTDKFFKFHKTDNIRFSSEVINYLKNKNLTIWDESLDFDVTLKKITSSSENTEKDNNIIITNLLSIKSEFPYGYSLNAGRLEYFYSEYVVNNIIWTIQSDELFFGFSSNKDGNDDHEIKIFSNSLYSETQIKSAVLDVFDFNTSKFKNEFLNKFDYEYELENQLTPVQWRVRDKFKEFVLF